MATVNFISYRRQSAFTLRGVMKYVSQDFKVGIDRNNFNTNHTINYQNHNYIFNHTENIHLISGKDCCGENAFSEFMATKNLYGKTDGVQFYHYTQSFKDGENISPQTAHEIAKRFAEDNYKNFEVAIFTHIDNEHLHSHFLINSVSFVDGKKLHQNPNTLRELRKYSDDICKEYGLSTLETYTFGRSKTKSRAEKRANEKGVSWKEKLAKTIDYCMYRSQNKEQFISLMQERGYGVKWTDSRKSITYHCPNNMDCRDNRLNNERYSKQNMELEFEFRIGLGVDNFTGWEFSRKQQDQEQHHRRQSYASQMSLTNQIFSLAKGINMFTQDDDDLETMIALVALTGLSFIGIYCLIDWLNSQNIAKLNDDIMKEVIEEIKEEPENIDGYEEEDLYEEQGFGMSMM
jgi:hypothetical protein